MKIGWYSHHITSDEKTAENRSTGLFSGKFAGGAEMSDWEYKQFAPDGIEIVEVTGETYNRDELFQFDSVVVTGTEGFSNSQLIELSTCKPFVFVHHLQTPRKSLKQLIDNARLFVTHTPAHMARELKWTNPKETAQVLSAFDTSKIQPADKDEFALWAARNHPSKGELNAFNLSLKLEMPFIAMSDKPREDVLQAMSYAEYFIHVPLLFESECRAVMEAVLAGCKVITNENVGITSVQDWDEPDALRNMIDKAGETFWRLVLR
jgi:hypothetical protein